MLTVSKASSHTVSVLSGFYFPQTLDLSSTSMSLKYRQNLNWVPLFYIQKCVRNK